MPTPTYTPLATVTLGASASSVTFSSIPDTYRDLIVAVAHSKSALTSYTLRFNGDTTSGNYTGVYMAGDGVTAFSGTGNTVGFGDSLTSQIFQIMDYSATDKHKTHLLRHNRSQSQVVAFALRWANTAAITSMAFTTPTGTFSAGSTFSLYGVIA
jgi:hypothetical protein